MSRKAIGPWRAAINWHLAVLIFGGFAATLIPIPYLAFCCIKYGLPPPEPSWTTLRVLQILQSLVIGIAGGHMAFAYFSRKFDITYAQMRFQLKVIAIAVPLCCVLLLVGISIPKYGLTTPLLLSALLIFGTFTAIFLAGSFHYARRLTSGTESSPTVQITK